MSLAPFHRLAALLEEDEAFSQRASRPLIYAVFAVAIAWRMLASHAGHAAGFPALERFLPWLDCFIPQLRRPAGWLRLYSVAAWIWVGF